MAEASAQFKPIAADRLKQHLLQLHSGLAGEGGKGGVIAMSKDAKLQQYVAALVKEIDNLQAACGTAPLPQPIPPLRSAGSDLPPPIPIDTQAPLAKAIAQAGDSLEAALGRTAGAAHRKRRRSPAWVSGLLRHQRIAAFTVIPASSACQHFAADEPILTVPAAMG